MGQKKIQLIDSNKELITFVKFTMGTAFTTQIVVERITSEKLYPELKKKFSKFIILLRSDR